MKFALMKKCCLNIHIYIYIYIYTHNVIARNMSAIYAKTLLSQTQLNSYMHKYSWPVSDQSDNIVGKMISNVWFVVSFSH